MWFMCHWSVTSWRQPKPGGAANVVFSSPAANSGRPCLSQTAWCRWITSTRATLPSVRTRFGVKEVM